MPVRGTVPIDIKEVEKLVFRKLISNPKTLAANLNKISPEDFSIRLAKDVIEALGQNGNSIHYAPNREYFEIILRDHIVKKDDLEAAAGKLAEIAKNPEDQKDLDLLIKELKNTRMCRELAKIVQETIPAIDPGRIEETYDSLVEKLLKLPISGSTSHSVGTLKEVNADIEDRLGMYLRPTKKKFLCGPKAFNDTIGGFAPGEVIILTAPTGGGKSAVMLWWCEEFLKAGANVLYITLEMSYEETMERYHSMVTALSVRKIRNHTLSDHELAKYFESLIIHSKHPSAAENLKTEFATILQKTDPKHAIEISRKFPERKNKFFVLDIPRNCTPARVEREIARLSLDVPIHLCVVDYLNIMEPNFHSKDHVREQASIAQDLKGVARKMGTIVMSAAQLNTANMDDDAPITTDDVKYCRAIGENCDWMAAFRQSAQDKAMKQLRIQLAKHRFSASATALLEIDFDTMQFLDLGNADAVVQPEKTAKEAAQERKGAYFS